MNVCWSVYDGVKAARGERERGVKEVRPRRGRCGSCSTLASAGRPWSRFLDNRSPGPHGFLGPPRGASGVLCGPQTSASSLFCNAHPESSSRPLSTIAGSVTLAGRLHSQGSLVASSCSGTLERLPMSWPPRPAPKELEKVGASPIRASQTQRTMHNSSRSSQRPVGMSSCNV